MAKGVYSLQIWMFGKQLQLSTEESEEFFKVCSFVASTYVKYWYTCPIATSAPANDLELLKSLSSRKERHLQAAFTKLCNHLWYLSETLVCFALIDEKVSFDEKRQTAKAMKVRSGSSDVDVSPRAQLPPNRPIKSHKLADFSSEKSLRFFAITGISPDFLVKDPTLWSVDSDYLKGLNIVRHIRVVNDTAERGVDLISKFLKVTNNRLTKNESQRQYLMLVVDKHRKLFDKTGAEKSK